MNRASVFLFFVVSLAVFAVNYADHHEDENSSTPIPDENQLADCVNKTMTGDEAGDSFIMMPSSDKAVMMLNGGKQKATCYVCSRPCSSIYCCNDSHPQCCSVNGYCGCCRR